MMITNISLSPSLLQIAIDAFLDGVQHISDQLILEFTFILKKQNNEILDYLTAIEIEPAFLESIDYDEQYEIMEKNAIRIKRLLNTLEAFKNKSDAFKELYKTLDDLYTTLITTPIEIGFLEAKNNHLTRKLNAS